MAAYHWLKGLFGLWASWVLLSILNLFTGFVWGAVNFIRGTVNNTIIGFPAEISNALDTVYNWFTSIWNWVALAVFTAFLFYIWINSMRRDVDEYYSWV